MLLGLEYVLPVLPEELLHRLLPIFRGPLVDVGPCPSHTGVCFAWVVCDLSFADLDDSRNRQDMDQENKNKQLLGGETASGAYLDGSSFDT